MKYKSMSACLLFVGTATVASNAYSKNKSDKIAPIEVLSQQDAPAGRFSILPTMKKYNSLIFINGYYVNFTRKKVSVFRDSGTNKLELVNYIAVPEGHELSGIAQISKDEIAVNYTVYAYKNPSFKKNHRSMQIIKIDKEGRALPMQKIDSGGGPSKTFNNVIDNEIFLLQDDPFKLNRGSDYVVYRKDSSGKYTPGEKIKDASLFMLGQSVQRPEKYYLKLFSYKGKSEHIIMELDKQGKEPKVVFRGGKGKNPSLPARPDSNYNVTRLGGDIFIKSHSAQTSEHLLGVEVFRPNAKTGEFESYGEVPVDRRENRGYDRTAKKLSNDGFVINDQFSFTTGFSSMLPRLRNFTLDQDIKIVEIIDGKLKIQTITFEGSYQLDDPRAHTLAVHVLNENEFIVFGTTVMKIVRRHGKTFKVDESLEYDRDKYGAILGSQLKFTRISENKFLASQANDEIPPLQRFVEKENTKQADSQIHAFEKKNGKYVYVGSKSLPEKNLTRIVPLDETNLMLFPGYIHGDTAQEPFLFNWDELNFK